MSVATDEKHQRWAEHWVLDGHLQRDIARAEGVSMAAESYALGKPAIRSYIASLKTQHSEEIRARIRGLAVAAARVLKEALESPDTPGYVRVSASLKVLEWAAFPAREIDSDLSNLGRDSSPWESFGVWVRELDGIGRLGTRQEVTATAETGATETTGGDDDQERSA